MPIKQFIHKKNLWVEKKFVQMKNFYEKIDVLITVGGITSFEALSSNIKCIYIPINYYQKTTCEYLKKCKISNVLTYGKVFKSKRRSPKN